MPLSEAAQLKRLSLAATLRRVLIGELEGKKIAGRWMVRVPDAKASR